MPPSNETAPLLQQNRGRTDEQDVHADEESLKLVNDITPLPHKQILILCGMRFSEPVSYNLVGVSKALLSILLTRQRFLVLLTRC